MAEVRLSTKAAGEALFKQIEKSAGDSESTIQLKFVATGFEITPTHTLDHLRAIAEEAHAQHGLGDDDVKTINDCCDRIAAVLAPLTAEQLADVAARLRARKGNP